MLIAELGKELGQAEFGDARLSKRLAGIAQAIGNQSNASFPSAMKPRAEREACYRYQQVRGAGPMSSETRRGAFFHPSIAFDQSGVALGIVGSHIWTRTKLDTDDRSTKDKKRQATPIGEKESYRWLQGFHHAKDVALRCPETTCVSVSDSEADMYELFSLVNQQRAENLHVIVRGCKNRRTEPGGDWVEQAIKSDVIATYTVNIVLCEERKPPEGEIAISWNLVTTMPIETDEDVQRVIETYCLRWQIEVYFRTLKSGCRIEERRFETIGRVQNCLALMSVLAWRLMYVCYLGRECPDMDCEVIFTPG